jgi:hypothetical protein
MKAAKAWREVPEEDRDAIIQSLKHLARDERLYGDEIGMLYDRIYRKAIAALREIAKPARKRGAK